jgi:hypothetical protein
MTYDVEPNLQRLIAAHLLLFRGRAPAISSHVSAGWYVLLDRLCSDIEATLGPEDCAGFEVRQIKEKFGVLRYYYRLNGREDLHIDIASSRNRKHLVRHPPHADGPDATEARVRELVTAACVASEFACEVWGSTAQLRDLGGYLTSLCGRHLVEAEQRRAQRKLYVRGLQAAIRLGHQALRDHVREGILIPPAALAAAWHVSLVEVNEAKVMQCTSSS